MDKTLVKIIDEKLLRINPKSTGASSYVLSLVVSSKHIFVFHAYRHLNYSSDSTIKMYRI